MSRLLFVLALIALIAVNNLAWEYLEIQKQVPNLECVRQIARLEGAGKLAPDQAKRLEQGACK